MLMTSHERGVKDYAYPFIGQIRCKEKVDVLQLSLSHLVGQEYFDQAIRHLNYLTDADYTFVGRLNQEKTEVITVSLCDRDQHLPAISYKLSGTPCEEAVLNGACFVEDVLLKYPNDKLLSELGICSYLGVAIGDSIDGIRGIVVSLFKLPVPDTHEVRTAFEFFAHRIKAELDRVYLTETLARREELYRFAIKTGNFGIYEWINSNNSATFNERLFDIIEHSPEEFVPSYPSWRALIHPDDVAAVDASVNDEIEGRKKSGTPRKYRIRTNKGDYKWIKVESNTYEFDETGKPTRCIGIVTDIDIEVRREKLLQESLQKEIELNKALASKEERYAFALKAGNLGVFDWNLVTGRMTFNEQLVRVMGEALIQDNEFYKFFNVIHPDDRSKIRQRMSLAKLQNKVSPADRFRVAYDQAYRWVEIQSKAVEWDHDGKINRIIGIIRDIDAETRTELVLKESYDAQREFNAQLKKREEELLDSQGKLVSQMSMLRKLHKDLEESESRWAYALEGNGDGVWDWDVHSDACFLSLKARELVGADRVRNFSDILNFIHPDYADCVRSQVEFSLKAPYDAFISEVQILDLNNNYRWVYIRGKVVEFKDGAVKRMVGTITDITQIKRIQKEHVIYEEMIKQNQASIIFTSLEGTIEFCNQTTLDMLGYALHEIIGKPIANIMCGDRNENFLSHNHRVEQNLITKNGLEITALLHVSKLYDEDGSLGYVVNGIDITENKQLKDDLVALAMDKLEGELLAQRKQTEMAIEVQENEKGFLARELHDGVGQMVSLIKLQIENLMCSLPVEFEPKCKNTLDLIQQVTADIKGLTNDLMPLSLRNIGLESAIASLIDRYGSLSEKGISIECRLNLNGYEPDEKIAIHIYRVAQEAINNAMKYSKASTLSVILLKLKNTINLLIEDNGQGFDLDDELGKKNSYGLKTMRERAKLINSKLLINSVCNGGTSINLITPINEQL